MSRPDALALLPLAESIADGAPIDWAAAEAGASDRDLLMIRQLRVLSSLAGLHRSLPPQPASEPLGAPPARQPVAAPAIGGWAHLSLIERLGGGTFGEVYRAWDRHLEREVALKLLRGAESTDDLRASRIANEGRLLARVRHPNVITVHGVDVHDRRVGLWMELVRGVTLEQQIVTRGALSAREAAAVGIDLCRALAAIHAAGLIHRDVKAQNVMREDGGRIVLMDLGTGREADARVSADLAGTPLYLAPEIFDGAPASERTDLYSLGVLLYHLVTGSFPVRATTIEELHAGHAAGAGVRLRDARADLPTAFVRVVDRAIAIDPKQRYATAGAFEADLVQALDGPTSTAIAVAVPQAAGPAGWSRRWSASLALAAAAAVTLLTLAMPTIRTFFGPAPMRLASRGAILVADFTNQTGESVFDGTLKEALTVQLQQSPNLNAFGAGSVEVAVPTAGRAVAPDRSAAAARDLCNRHHMKTMVLGSIARSGDQYLVTVQAQNCQTGEEIAQGHAQAPSRAGVLRALGVATAGLRESFGDSSATNRQFNVPVEEATTGSLDALKAYSVGNEMRSRAGEVEAIPYFNHALELDPRFALAEGKLAAIYANLHEYDQSKLHTKKAFELSEHVTERERLYIRGSYHVHVTGHLDEAIGAYRLWTELYPVDWMPFHNLGNIYLRIGQFDDALKQLEKARSLNPDQVMSYEALANTLLAIGRFDDARATVRLAQSRDLDAAINHVILLQLALIDGGGDAMRKEFTSMSDGVKNYVIVAAAARGEAFGGDFQTARSLTAQAVAKAMSGRMNDFAASLMAEDAMDAAVAGERDYAHQAGDRALAISRGSETLWACSLASAFSGRRKVAEELTADYLRITPPTTDVVAVFGPVLRAANALAEGQYQRAIETLQPALAYDRIGRFWPAYIRGLASLGLKQPREAERHFAAILSHRGDDPAGVLFPLAMLQQGRARRAAGDAAGARESYDGFISAWHGARRDQPLLAAAVRERSLLSP